MVWEHRADLKPHLVLVATDEAFHLDDRTLAVFQAAMDEYIDLKIEQSAAGHHVYRSPDAAVSSHGHAGFGRCRTHDAHDPRLGLIDHGQPLH